MLGLSLRARLDTTLVVAINMKQTLPYQLFVLTGNQLITRYVFVANFYSRYN